jgi:hypothetical protein
VTRFWERLLGDSPDQVSTVHLGQFSRETANEIAGELEGAGIAWWYKEPGWLASVWEFGVRLFVDEGRLAQARSIADRIVAERNPDLR